MRRFLLAIGLVSSLGGLMACPDKGYALGLDRACRSAVVVSSCTCIVASSPWGWSGVVAATAMMSEGPGPTVETAPERVERTVTCYRPEFRTREVPVTVYKCVPREEKYTYTETVPVTKAEKRTCTYYTTVTKEVPYAYQEKVAIMKPETRTQTFYATVTKEVPYNYSVCVPVSKPEKRAQTFYTTVTKEVP